MTTTRGDPIGSSKLVFVMAPQKYGISKKGDGHYSYVSYKGKNIDGPIRQGPHAETKALSDLQVLREANTSLATLETAASALKSAAAASETPSGRNERSWEQTTNR